jgi:hypothetical protein
MPQISTPSGTEKNEIKTKFPMRLALVYSIYCISFAVSVEREGQRGKKTEENVERNDLANAWNWREVLAQKMFKRTFHSTPLGLFPRLPYQPKKALPLTSPKPATAAQMEELFALHGKPVEMKSYPKPYPPKK